MVEDGVILSLIEDVHIFHRGALGVVGDEVALRLIEYVCSMPGTKELPMA